MGEISFINMSATSPHFHFNDRHLPTIPEQEATEKTDCNNSSLPKNGSDIPGLLAGVRKSLEINCLHPQC